MWHQAIVRELPVVPVIKLAAPYERELTHHEIGERPPGESRHGVTPPYQSTTRTGERDDY